MELHFSKGRVIKEPTEADIRACLDAERSGVLYVGPDEFMQYGGPTRLRPTFQLEYKDGSQDGLFQAAADHISRDQILAALLKYLRGDSSWQLEYRWKKLNLPQGIPPKRPAVTKPAVEPAERVSWTPSLAMASTFRERYRIVVEGLHGALSVGAGLSEEEIALAEQKLGFKVPTALSDFYLLAGRFKGVTEAHNRFYAPADYVRDGDKIVFLEGHQAAFFWGLDASQIQQSDPPIFQGVKPTTTEVIEWYPECDRCSDFLVGMICWQAANGGLPYGGFAAAPESIASELRKVMTLVWEVLRFVMFGENGAVVCLVQQQDSKEIQAAARTRGDLERIRQTFGLNWTFSIDPEDA